MGFNDNAKIKKFEQLKIYLEEKYNIRSLAELNKLKSINNNSNGTGSREASDLLGEWSKVDQRSLVNITVGTDQKFDKSNVTNGYD